MASSFSAGNVYLNPNTPTYLWVCTENTNMGRLEQFVNIGTNCFKSTGVKYFLSFWRQEDGGLKSYFVNPENYEHVGILNTNYKLQDEFLNKI